MIPKFIVTFSIHPLFVVLCCYSAGIYLQSENYHLAIIISLAIALLILSILHKKIYSLRPILYACVFLAGTYGYNHQITTHNQFFSKITTGQPYALTGTIDQLENLPFNRYSAYCILKNAALYEQNSDRVLHKGFCVGLYSNNFKDLCIDDTISLSAVSLKKQNSSSYQQYLMKEGLVATSFLPNECTPLLISRPAVSLKRSIFNKKNELFNALKNKMSAQSFTFFSSLFLGVKTKSYYYDKVREHFKRWGLSHYLARSGLHLILFIALWQLLLRYIPLAFLIKQLLLSCIIILYFIFSWPSLPFTRSCITYALYCFYIFSDKQIDSLHILTLVTSLILITNPVQLFSLDFQLSFGLTFALIWFTRMQKIHNKQQHS